MHIYITEIFMNFLIYDKIKLLVQGGGATLGRKSKCLKCHWIR